jgi:hypothetical protein
MDFNLQYLHHHFLSFFSLFRPQKRGPGQVHVRAEERRGPKRPVAEPRLRLDYLDYFINNSVCLIINYKLNSFLLV